MLGLHIDDGLLIKDKRPYVLWRRVSTKTQGESGLGLEAQYTIAKAFTGREPEKIYTDVYSGTKLKDCEQLWAAIQYCKERDRLLVIAKTDRFRNVKEALEVLDAIGEGNLSFCDIPSVNRMILTIMFSVWESQAMMGRINTKLALQERLKQAAEKGYWVSKTGRVRTHLGRDKGCNMDTAVAKAVATRQERLREWQETSVGYQWVQRQLLRGVPREQIIDEFNEFHKMGVQGFESRAGNRMTKAILSQWEKKMGLR